MTCLVTRTEDFIVHRWISLIDALQYSITQIEKDKTQIQKKFMIQLQIASAGYDIWCDNVTWVEYFIV